MTSSRGKIYIPNTLWTWAFFLVVLAQLIVCVVLNAYVLADFEESLARVARNGNSGSELPATIPTYLTIFIFGFLYQLLLTWDALRLKNTIQVIGLCLYNIGLLIYSAVEIDQLQEAVTALAHPPGAAPGAAPLIDDDVWGTVHPFLVAVPCVIALCTVILSGIAWKLYGEFAWTIYKHISADLRLKRRYLQYQIYIAFLKFDFFFFLAFTVQFLVATHDLVSNAEWAVTIAAIPVSIVLLILAAYFTRRESTIGQSGVIVLAFAAMAYFIFKLVRMYEPSQEYKYGTVQHSLTTFAVLAILLLICTIIASFMCLRNFNKGLKPHIQQQKFSSPEEASKYAGYGDNDLPATEYNNGTAHQLGHVPNRMTID